MTRPGVYAAMVYLASRMAGHVPVYAYRAAAAALLGSAGLHDDVVRAAERGELARAEGGWDAFADAVLEG